MTKLLTLTEYRAVLSERDRLRALNAELLAALEDWLNYAETNLSEFDLEDCVQATPCPRCRPSGCITLKIRNARAAIDKAKP